ncbi:hypothetical protein [Colwellia sp. BRX8-9]|uniref:hypothetical protein n=1 Tax=Colwellia sp. BRX8-9 TaxID=2759831 RepID=UPI0015F514BE|nr:hypothetical protein [Colwellia sp. BRX8-9]MBA6348680.1 hypothetical protein [Colwellia sp. BRX8-9]
MKSLFKIIILLALAELSFGYIHFQKSWEKGSAFFWAVNRGYSKYFAVEKGQSLVSSRSGFKTSLVNLKKTLDASNIKFSVLYIPVLSSNLNPDKKKFFHSTAEENQICFIDASDTLNKHPSHWIYNLPSDSHLSRLGHILVYEATKNSLERCGYSSTAMEKTLVASIEGPHPKNVDTVDQYNSIAYRLRTNAQGFRMTDEVRENQPTVLILGDSFTFGTGVNTVDTFSNLLSKDIKELNILNTGIPGTSIIEQSHYLYGVENLSAIDGVILQVLDNDIL